MLDRGGLDDRRGLRPTGSLPIVHFVPEIAVALVSHPSCNPIRRNYIG